VPFDLVAAGVLLDMDGTLVDSTAVVESLWREFAHAYGVDAAAVLAFAHGRPTMDTIAAFLPGRDRAELEAIERAATEDEIRRLDGIVEVRGAAAFVRALLAQAVPVALVTSASPELARVRMRAAGVPLPPVLVTPGDVARGKPAPDGYLRAAALLGVAAGDCVVFEDAPAGVAAAVAAGARTVVVGGLDESSAGGLPQVPDLRAVSVARERGVVHLRG